VASCYRSLAIALGLAPLVWAQRDCRPLAPCYSAEGIANSASGQVQALAPYTFATIYGDNLSNVERGRTSSDPLPGIGGVNVLVNGVQSMVFYVSARQVNFLVPATVRFGKATIQLTRDGQAGPAVQVELQDVAPALFQLDTLNAVGLRMPGYLVATPEYPAHPGEYVVLYATGLGDYAIPVGDYDPPQQALPMQRRGELQVLLDGVAVEDSRIEYAGCVVGYWGLFQINLKLPEQVADNPEIRILVSGAMSPTGLHLPVHNQ
jgi:uncharacterized protein (TIGR03437 family)